MKPSGLSYDRILQEVAASWRALVAVLRSPDLRRIHVAYVGYNTAEWASFIAISVYAFQLAGPGAVGAVAVVQLVPSAIVAPFAAVLGDRFRREQMLRIAYGVETVAVGTMAVALIAGAPAWLIFVLAGVVAVSFTLVRPIHESLIPLLARSPSETTAGYVVAGMIAKASAVVGPLLAAAVMAVAGPGEVFAALFVVLLLSTLLLGRLQIRTEPASRFEEGTHMAEAVRGFELMIKDSRQRLLVTMMGGANFVLGLLDILIVALAFDVFGSGEPGTGVLNAALGVGGIAGAIGAVSLIGRDRLAPTARNGMLLYGLPIALIALATFQSVAFLLLVAAGTGAALVAVSGHIMLHRVAPSEALSRVFGVVEASYMAGEAAGAVVGAVLVANLGITASLVISGLLLPAFWLLRRGALARADVGMAVDPAYVELLHSLPLFEALGPAELERIADNARFVRVPAGTAVVIEGDEGDRFYLIADGSASVTKGERRLANLDRGEFFGEIALLRDVPRTATVLAATDLELLTLDREHFVEAIVPFSATACTTEEFINQRLAAHDDDDASR